jgi:superfamily II DNA/RNA helicase
LPRVLRNATAALIDIEKLLAATEDEQDKLVAVARRLGQLWEGVARISDGPTKSLSLVNAILAYEISGYQANSICIARELAMANATGNADTLTELVSAFFRRLFVYTVESAKGILNLTSDDLDYGNLVDLASKGLVASALIEAAAYFLRGDDESLGQALETLGLASSGFTSIGAVAHFSLARLLLMALPRMKSRSTWELLKPVNPTSETWHRYLLLLSRGLGTRVDQNSGIVELWPSQIQALKDGLFDADASTMVKMPTSAGKTRIAEMAIVHHLVTNPGSRCIYIAPFRALAGELEESLAGLFSDLGYRLSTTLGSFETDEAEQAVLDDADIIISTPEKLDLLLRLRRDFMDMVGLIVVDEGQLVGDASRGPNFEILLSRIHRQWPAICFISLSAVVPRETLDEFASWLGSGRVNIAVSDWRPAIQRVAAFEWQGNSGRLRFLNDSDTQAMEGFVPRVIQSRTYSFINPQTLKRNTRHFPDRTTKAQTAAELAYTLAPTGAVLVFCPTKRIVESVSDALVNRLQLALDVDQEILPQFVEREIRSAAISAEWLGLDHPLTQKLRRGIAPHHGDIPDVVRRAIEEDFRNREFQVVVATSTLAQGVNLPIRTVIVHSSSRYEDGESRPILARDYWNIAGRAGRAREETEGLIIHICGSPRDFRELLRYESRRDNPEPIESALFRILQRSLLRVNDEQSTQYLDSALLALLVEEDVAEVTDSWVSEVLASTLAAEKVRRELTDDDQLVQVLTELFQEIVTRVPSSQKRTDYYTTGLCIESCELLTDHIRQNSDALRMLLPSATLSDRRSLVDIFIEGCFLAEEIRPKDEPAFEVPALADLWLSGTEMTAIRAFAADSGTDPRLLSRFIEEVFGYRLPWGISAYLRLAAKELQLNEAAFSNVVRYFSSMLKYGVPSPYAVWAVTLGVDYRSIAIQLGQSYIGGDLSGGFTDFAAWASELTIEDLSQRFGLVGPRLRDVASAIRKASPSPLLRQTQDRTRPTFPLRGQIVVRQNLAMSVASNIRAGDSIGLQRDYDQVFDRNAVGGFYEREWMGPLGHDVAQFLAPLMDAGSRYEGMVTEVKDTGSKIEIQVAISALTTSR